MEKSRYKKIVFGIFASVIMSICMGSHQIQASDHYSKGWPVEIKSELPQGKKKRFFKIGTPIGQVKEMFDNEGQRKDILQVMVAGGKEMPDGYRLTAADVARSTDANVARSIVVKLDPDKSVEVQWEDTPLKQFFMVGTTIQEVKNFFSKSLEFKGALVESLHLSDISPDYMKVNVKGKEEDDSYQLQKEDRPVVVWLTAKKIATSLYKRLRPKKNSKAENNE